MTIAKRYPAYVQAHRYFLTDLPDGWKLTRLKQCTSVPFKYGANVPSSEYVDNGLRFLRTSDITDDGRLTSDEAAVYVSDDIDSSYLLSEGDLLLSRSGTIGRSLRYRNKFGKAVFAGYLVRFRLDQRVAHPDFVFYWTKSALFRQQITADTIETTIGNFNGQRYANLWLPLPTLFEQQTIAAFLDHETARIDRLIEKQQRLIELLQEKRQAVISHAVTKGVNPDVPMKDSGVEWLGEVPEHWLVTRLGWQARVRSGDYLNNNLMEAESTRERGAFPVIGGNGLIGYTLDHNVTEPIIAVGRVGALCGNTHLISDPCWITDNALMVFGIRSFDLEYLHFALHVLDLNRFASQTAQPLITGTLLRSQRLPRPTISEQQDIVLEVRNKTHRIDALSERADRMVGQLREHRTALISAAVTGKIDVRDWKPPSDESDEELLEAAEQRATYG